MDETDLVNEFIQREFGELLAPYLREHMESINEAQTLRITHEFRLVRFNIISEDAKYAYYLVWEPGVGFRECRIQSVPGEVLVIHIQSDGVVVLGPLWDTFKPSVRNG